MQTIYCISGLGVDERLFYRVEIPGYLLKHVKWSPYDKRDTIQSYANKLLAQIDDENPIIMGVSFGGMIAVEMADMVNARQVIIVSSSKTKHEIPWLYRFIGKTGLLHIAPVWLVKRVFFVLYYLFGIKKKEDKKLLRDILKGTNNGFIRWSTLAISRWKRTNYASVVTHIHGDNDRILYPHCVKPDYWIKNGGHLIIVQNYMEVNGIVGNVLE